MEPALAAFDHQPALGGHPYGQLVAQHMHEGANGPQSARAVLKQLETILEMSIEALQRASDQYEETEANTVDALTKTSRSI
ncbi:hypothetical protein ACWGRK_11905 [Saccharomonospora azurea]